MYRGEAQIDDDDALAASTMLTRLPCSVLCLHTTQSGTHWCQRPRHDCGHYGHPWPGSTFKYAAGFRVFAYTNFHIFDYEFFSVKRLRVIRCNFRL